MLVFLSLLAALVLGALVAVTITPAVGVALGVLLLLAGLVAQRAAPGPRRAIGVTLLLALLAGGSYGAVLAIEVVDAVTTTQGTPEPADPALLGSAQDKLAGIGDGAFRLELTEPELQAVVQDGIARNPDLPIRSVELDLRGATSDLAFIATFKTGSVRAEGTATLTAVGGGIDLALGPLRFGAVPVPGVASGAVQSLLSSVTDLNAALQAQQATVQAIEVGDHSLVVIGTRAGGEALTDDELLDSIGEQAAAGAGAVQAPPEVLGPGTVDGLEAPGDPILLALGDSLAANVGVDQARDGYVSRLHRALSDRDGVAYGLVNLGESGATSGTLLSGGQVTAAEQVLATRPAAYVTLDIGANDLLGHLQSADCNDLTSQPCQQRVEETLVTYRANLEAVLDRLTAASGGGRVAMLQFYNPFSLGLGEGQQEAESSRIIARLNAVAADVAAARGVTVADGFTPMQGTTAATTHMVDPVPDIHPNAIGYDVLANALFTALQ